MKEHVLAVRGVGGYRQYRIPAMAVTPSGKIIAIYDARADFDDLPGPIDLVIRTSDDNGTTWSPQEVFRRHEGIEGYGDASIVIDPASSDLGRIIVFYQWTRQAGFFESILGSDLDNPLIAHIGRSISDDDGKTWRHDVITDQLKDGITPGIFATSGMGGRIEIGKFAGRLLQTFVLRREFELLSAIGFSDDHGESWQLGALIPGGNETAITGLKDGSILVHSRATPYRIAGRSLDGGETLSTLGPDEALLDPSDNGSLFTLSSGDVMCTHNHDSDLRRNTMLKRSTDNGITWSTGVSIEPGSSAYSTACELSDGNVGILYERDAYQEIVFKRVSLGEFESTEKILNTDSHELDIEFTVVPRYIRPGRNHEIEAQLSQSPKVPEVDISGFRITERKEVGAAGGSTSGDSLFSTEELNKILGSISPGLHENDEVRFSARIKNNRSESVQKIIITDRKGEKLFKALTLDSGEKMVLLDLRQTITDIDVELGIARFEFQFSGNLSDSDDQIISEFKKVVTVEMPTN